jgi:hypothetical protein
MFADVTPRFTAMQNAWKCYCFDVLCRVDMMISVIGQNSSVPGDSSNYCDCNLMVNPVSIFVANKIWLFSMFTCY